MNYSHGAVFCSDVFMRAHSDKPRHFQMDNSHLACSESIECIAACYTLLAILVGNVLVCNIYTDCHIDYVTICILHTNTCTTTYICNYLH